MPREQNNNQMMYESVLNAATELFEGNRQMAEDWMSKPLPAIGHAIPADYIDSPERAQHLLDIIGRLEHGVWT